MVSGRSPILPGRLASPDMVLRDDPRADPRLVAAMAAVGLDGEQPAAGVDADASLEALLAYCDVAEPGFEALFSALAIDLPPVEGVTASVEVIRGIDGNDVTLFIHRPTAVTGPLPVSFTCTVGAWSSWKPPDRGMSGGAPSSPRRVSSWSA